VYRLKTAKIGQNSPFLGIFDRFEDKNYPTLGKKVQIEQLKIAVKQS